MFRCLPRRCRSGWVADYNSGELFTGRFLKGRLTMSRPNMSPSLFRRVSFPVQWVLKTPVGFRAFGLLIPIISAIVFLSLVAHADHSQERLSLSQAIDRTKEPKYRTDHVLVRFRSGTSRAAMARAHSVVRGEV